jgi:hypothetical protein
MSRGTATKLARRLVAVAALAVLAYPPGTTTAVHWIAEHDMIDVPYVRDCHGLYRRTEECPADPTAGRPTR